MSLPEQLHRTVIEQPDFLDVGIAVETYLEEVACEGGGYFLLFSRSVTWMGFAEDMRLYSGRSYLQGQKEGIHQVIKIEFPDRDSALSVSENWHKVGCITAEQMKPQIKAAALLKLASGM